MRKRSNENRNTWQSNRFEHLYQCRAHQPLQWFCRNKRKDMDNISFAKKFILDGMQEVGYLKNDGWNEIAGWEESFHVDRDNPRIEIEIEEAAE